MAYMVEFDTSNVSESVSENEGYGIEQWDHGSSYPAVVGGEELAEPWKIHPFVLIIS